MPRILILYGTTDGHTAKIAGALAETLRGEGAEVEVVNAGGDTALPRPEDFQGVIVAASVHISGYQRAVRHWVAAHAAALNARPTAFVSVCLGVLERKPETDRELAAIVGRFLERTGWRPGLTRTAAGALPFSRYNWLKRWVMRRIARKAGVDTDPRRDYEYTDWEDLKALGREFFHLVGAR